MNNMVKHLNSYVSKNIAEPVYNAFNSIAEGPMNVVNKLNSNKVVANSVKGASGISYGIYIVIGIFVLALVLISMFYKSIKKALDDFMNNMGTVGPAPLPDNTIANGPPRDSDPISSDSIVEKVLPGKKELFNISSNRYAYADAEPLCKALGAELATYDQVKEAWDKGADWCNYGWTKGQLALYPTQESTWKELQDGPEEQRGVCGRTGVNGGYFDNPDLRFGVNCYGPKPSQSSHDARTVASADNRPVTPAVIDYEKKVAKFKAESDTIGVLPFNKNVWA